MRKIRAIRLSHCVTYLTVLGLLFGGAGQVRAQGYDLSILAKSGDTIAGKELIGLTSARINNNDLVAFLASYSEGGFSREGIFTFDGANGTLLVSFSHDGGPSVVCDGKTLRSTSAPRLNDNDIAAFFGSFPGNGIFTHDGTTCTFIGGSQGGLLEINDNDVLAHGVAQPAIIVIELLPGGPAQTGVAQQGDVVAGKTITNTNGLALRLNNNNVVVFNGEFSDGMRRIVKTDLLSSLSIFAEPGDVCDGVTITDVIHPETNDNNELVFAGTFAGGAGFFRKTAPGGACTVVVKEGDVCGGGTLDRIDVIGQHKMNNDGVVAFVGRHSPTSNFALFAASDAGCTMVAQVGDAINGATISSVTSRNSGTSLNNAGVFAFEGNIDDGGTDRKAIMLAELILDSDGDGVLDDMDLCPDTPLGDAVDSDGCSIDQLVPCVGPDPDDPTETWKNHGQYMKNLTHTAQEFVDAGLITEAEKDAIVSAGAGTSCGK